MSELKPVWKRMKFGEVVRLCRETCKDPAADGIDRAIGLEHLEPGDLRVRSWSDIADGTRFTQRVRPGQVLFGKRRAYQRKVAVADFEAVCSGDIYVFESADPQRLLPELLPFLCQTDAFFEHAIGTSAGSLSPRTNWSSLSEYEFALPPLEEQRRIATARNAQESAAAALLEVVSSAAQLRRSLLAEHLPVLPGSVSIPLGSLAQIVRGSTPRPAGDPRYFNGRDVPWITVGEITGSAEMYLTETATMLTVEGAKRSRFLEKGTVILSNSGWTLGVPKILALSGCANDGVAAFSNLAPTILPEFLYYSLERQTEYFRTVVAAGGDQPNLNIARIGDVEVPVPPIAEQRALIGRMRDIDETVAAAKRRLTTLRAMVFWSEENP